MWSLRSRRVRGGPGPLLEGESTRVPSGWLGFSPSPDQTAVPWHIPFFSLSAAHAVPATVRATVPILSRYPPLLLSPPLPLSLSSVDPLCTGHSGDAVSFADQTAADGLVRLGCGTPLLSAAVWCSKGSTRPHPPGPCCPSTRRGACRSEEREGARHTVGDQGLLIRFDSAHRQRSLLICVCVCRMCLSRWSHSVLAGSGLDAEWGQGCPSWRRHSPLLTCIQKACPPHCPLFEEPLFLLQPARPMPPPPYVGDGLASLPKGLGTGTSCLHIPHPLGTGRTLPGCPPPSAQDTGAGPTQGLLQPPPHPGLLRGSGLSVQDHPPPGGLTRHGQWSLLGAVL